jgi:hypothetical protein
VYRRPKTHNLCSKPPPSPPREDRGVYEVRWKNTAQPGRLRMTISHMHIECCITTDTNTYSKYVILIVSQLQQWLQVRALMLRYTYTACIVMLRFRPGFWLQNMTHLLFSALLDDRKLNSKTLTRSPIRCHSIVYQNQRNNVCTHYGCLWLNHRIKRLLTKHVSWCDQPRCPRYISTLTRQITVSLYSYDRQILVAGQVKRKGKNAF